jgi:tRNA (cytidine/uridine-2'-O-)-methyltransferase
MSSEPPIPLNVVLVEPEIPQNAGNIGRTCLGLGARLHLVGKLGFSLDEKEVKRAGLDYWSKVDLLQHKAWEDFLETVPAGAQLAFLSSRGEKSFWDVSLKAPLYLVFGSESRGLPPSLYRRHDDALFRIPMTGEIRSLNLATAVGIAAYEAARRLRFFPHSSLPLGRGRPEAG